MNNLPSNLPTTNTVAVYGAIENITKKTSTYSIEIYNCIDNKCSICLEVFDENKPIAKTLCNHIYHLACMEDILKYKKVCPLCNNNIKQYFCYNSKQHYQKDNATVIEIYDKNREIRVHNNNREIRVHNNNREIRVHNNNRESCLERCLNSIKVRALVIVSVLFICLIIYISAIALTIPMGNNSTNTTNLTNLTNSTT